MTELGAVRAEVPSAWRTLEGTSYTIPEQAPIGPGTVVSADPASWTAGWDVPGAFVAVSQDLADQLGTPGGSLIERLERLGRWHGGIFREAECDRDGASVFDSRDGQLTGFTTLWTNCGAAGATLFDVAAVPEDGSFVLVVEATGVTDAEVEAARRLVETISVDLDRVG